MSDLAIIELDVIDSTNNYAMQLIDANKAHHGLTIVAKTQTGGRGQRGRVWVDRPGESLLMTTILTPNRDVRNQFVFNASVSAAIANILQKMNPDWTVHIKWPNDMIINDKKAGGILIENVLRGSLWTHCVIGIGINVKQEKFYVDLPNATSLRMASGQDYDTHELLQSIVKSILDISKQSRTREEVMNGYNAVLYKRGQKQKFTDQAAGWEATVIGVLNNGTLEVELENGGRVCYQHGQVEWCWE